MDKSTAAIASYATEIRFEDLPAVVVHEAKRKLIDTLGCAMGAFDAEPCRIARAMARRSIGNPPAHILGTREPTTPELAAFANGTMVRCMDFSDSYLAQASCHPSDALSAVLATAEAAHAGGKAVITAAVLAYEISCNFADMLLREQGIDNVFYCLIGSALASAKILGLDLPQMGNAVAFSVIPNVTLEETRSGELSMWKGCAGANAARNGVFAAEAARAGLTGPDQAIEGKWGLWHALGRRFEWAPFGGRGGPFRIAQTHLKYYPAVIHAQSPITSALQLHGRVNPEDIEAIAIDTYWVAKRYDDRNSPLWHPTTSETADHSIPYVVAIALLDGDVSAASVGEQRLRDPRLHALMKTMSIREDPQFTAAYPAEWPSRIEITTKTGNRHVAATQYFKGHVKNPMSDAEVEDKFRQLTAGLLDASQTEAILAKLWSLDELKDIGEVLQLFAIRDNRGARVE